MKKLKKDPLLSQAEDLLETGQRILRKRDEFFKLDQYKGALKSPHPTRTALAKNMMLTPLLIGSPALDVYSYLRMTAETDDFYEWWINTVNDYSFSPVIKETNRKSDRAASGTFMGNSMSYMLSVRSGTRKIPIFEIDDRLVSLLDESDIGQDLTVGEIENTPFNLMYVELGEKHPLDLYVPNTETGDHRLEGFYVIKSKTPPNPHTKDTITFVFTGEPKANILDDATQMLMIEIGGAHSEKRIEDAVKEAIAKAKITGAEVSHLSPNRHMPENAATKLYKLMAMAAKSVLYLNHGKYNEIVDNKQTANRVAVSAITNPAKREKAERLCYGLSDKILIKPRDIPANAPSISEMGKQGSISVHWRRGHFRNQRYGESLSQVKPLWIAPTLVGLEKSADSVIVETKNYKIKGPTI